MDWFLVGASSLASGVGVVAATAAARRVGPPWAGLLAAFPFTPSAALLIMGDDGAGALLGGLAGVVATLVVLAVMAGARGLLRRVPVPLAIVLVVPLGAAALVPLPPVALTLAVVAAAAWAARAVARADVGRRVVLVDLPPWARFAMGAGAVWIVGAVASSSVEVAGVAALLPLTFTTVLVATQVTAGRAGVLRVLSGGVAGSVGVAAFAIAAWWFAPTVAAVGLLVVLAWSAYAAAALLWWRLTAAPRSLSAGLPG